MASIIPVLPLDIIGNIIDILANDNKTGLQDIKATSLTCQSFLPLCRTHIFSSIDITITGSNALTELHSGEAFGQFLSTTPDIARYIRKLSIRLHPDPKPRYLLDQVPRQLTRLEWLTILPAYHLIDWKDIQSPMQHSLLNFIHLPTLNHLDLRYFNNFPISNLIPIPNLKHLSATNLYIADEADEVVALVPSKLIKLRALDILMSGMAAQKWLATSFADRQPALDLTGLEKIVVQFSDEQLVVAARQIFQYARQLTDIHLVVNKNCFRALEFAKMITPSIQTLSRMHVAINANGLSMVDLLSDLCDELDKIAGKNTLNSLEIHIDLFRYEGGETGDEQWGRLEKILLNSGWSTLKHFSLHVIVYGSFEDNDNFDLVVKELPKTQFTGLTSSKTVNFQFSFRRYH